MASLSNIEKLTERLGGDEPKWVRGYTKRDNHLSGALREMQEHMGLQSTSIQRAMELLEEAAETLDDAHEDWLRVQIASRSLLADIEAMKCDGPDPDGDGSRGWFGGFSQYMLARDSLVSQVTMSAEIEWPNLEISGDNLAEALRGDES